MKRELKLLSSVVLILMLFSMTLMPSLASAWTTYPLDPVTDSEVSDALAYLQSQQNADGSITDFSQSAWVTMAIAAAGDDPNTWNASGDSIVDYLAAHAATASSATDYARMILAATAADQDPTAFGGIDFVALLEAQYDGTQIGSTTALNDDAWGIMALIAAGKSTTDPIVVNSAAYIGSNQNADGGWGWAVGQASDADSTAAPIMALIAAGEAPSAAVIQNALAYVKTQQMDSGGFDSWDATNADTDAWVISALVAAGEDPTTTSWESATGNNPIDDLTGFQAANGSYEWQASDPGGTPMKTTASAITALVGATYPVKIMTPSTDGETVAVRIEGETSTIWNGSVTFTDSTVVDSGGNSYYIPLPTTLGALDKAAQLGGFSYELTQYGSDYTGLFVETIAGEGGGATGKYWLYRVDYIDPGIGASTFELNVTSPPSPPHMEVLFFLSTTFSELPLKLELDKTSVAIDEVFTATVTYHNGTAWLPLEGATVHADTDYTTLADGTVEISVDHDATIDVYAEMDGYIRSKKTTVVVGTGGGPSGETGPIALHVVIIPAVAISVDTDTINFGGDLGPRDIGGPVSVTITNVGAWDVRLTAEVTDSADDLFIDGLYLDDALWSTFSQTINRGENHVADSTLHVPEDYTGIGAMEGSLIFWAEEA